MLGDKMLTAEQVLKNRIQQVAKFGRNLPTLQAPQKLNLFQHLSLDFVVYYFLCLLLPFMLLM